MGSESYNSNSISSSASNNQFNREKLEIMECKPENENTTIKRVWIAQRSITTSNGYIDLYYHPIYEQIKYLFNLKTQEDKTIKKFYINAFNISDKEKSLMHHWAIILELSNNTFVNIQYGELGFSLKEFNKTIVEGENIFNSILDTWGEINDPFSFFYLGDTNYEYEKLKNHLKEIKEKESKSFALKKCIDYSLIFKNCHDFCYDIENIIFGSQKFSHSFDININKFFKLYFPNLNITKLRAKHQEDIRKKNLDILKNNMNNIVRRGDDDTFKKTLLISLFSVNFYSNFNNNKINMIKNAFGLNFDDYAKYIK